MHVIKTAQDETQEHSPHFEMMSKPSPATRGKIKSDNKY